MLMGVTVKRNRNCDDAVSPYWLMEPASTEATSLPDRRIVFLLASARRVGFVFQLHHLLTQCTALENVLVPTLVRSDAGERESRAGRGRKLLERVGLGDL